MNYNRPMSALYPLHFEPILRRYVWGGRRLATLGKTLGDGDDYAESWELCDRPNDQSVVADGPLKGTTLGELVRTRGRELLGRHDPQDRFPLLVKFLDAHRKLSVQVHPDNARAARLTPPDLGKTEAWVVLAAEPGSVIYAGLKRGFDRAALAREVSRGTVELCLHTFEPHVGDCVFLPAGAVHALGEGLVIAEIQQSSDVTYRLFDWNRLGSDGKPRPLHIEPSLDAIDYTLGPINPVTPKAEPSSGTGNGIEQLVACDRFVMERWQLDASRSIGGDNRCRIVMVLDGAVTIDDKTHPTSAARGTTLLLPASLGAVKISPTSAAPTSTSSKPSATLLCAYLP